MPAGSSPGFATKARGERLKIPADMQSVREWIQLNETALVDYWDGPIYTDELIQRQQRLP